MKYIMKKIGTILQQRLDKYMLYTEFVRTYVELDNRLKALQEKTVGK